MIGGVCKGKKDDQVISYASFLESENLAGIRRQKGQWSIGHPSWAEINMTKLFLEPYSCCYGS